jgi:A/G-specific adenine glycosylase
VVDGNVIRVLSRVFGIGEPVGNTAVKKRLHALAEQCLDRAEPGVYNQAMMDFGATVCKPLQPLCGQCPMTDFCQAFQQGRVAEIPMKQARPARRQRWFHYLIIKSDDHVLLRKRAGRDVWKDLYEPFLIESDGPLTGESLAAKMESESWLRKIAPAQIDQPGYRKQVLTHQEIHIAFTELRLKQKPGSSPAGYAWYALEQLAGLAFPRTAARYFFEERNLG